MTPPFFNQQALLSPDLDHSTDTLGSTGGASTGIPDVHHCEAGISLWFEFKRTKKHKPSKLQKRMHKKLRNAGHIVVVVWKLSQIKKAIKLNIKLNKR